MWYGDEGLGGGGRYTIPRKGVLKLDQHDVAWDKEELELFFISKEKIKVIYPSNVSKRTADFLVLDPSDKYYLDLGKYF